MPRRNATQDPLITTFGRLLEATSGLEVRLGRAMEDASGLPLTWFEVLLRVSRSGGRLPMGELSSQLALTTGGMTRLVDRIVQAGYLRREQAGHDRRVVFAVLTTEGEAAVEQAAKEHVVVLREVFQGFSDAELTRLDRMLDRLRDA